MTEETKPSDDGLINEIMGEETAPVETKTEELPTEKPEVKEPEVKKLVDHGAFHEERERRKELQRKLEAESAERQKLEERFTKLFTAVSAPKEDEYIDPVEKLGKQVSAISETIQKSEERKETDQKNYEKELAFFNRVNASEQAFSQSTPDYYDAVKFLRETEAKELRLMGMSEQQIAADIQAKTKRIAEIAYQQEKSPAQVGYELATARGYKKKSTAPVKTIEQVEKSIEASKSLSPGGQPDTGSGIESLSMREINDLSDEEFDRMWKDLEKRGKKRA